MLPNTNFKPIVPSEEERVPVHATQDELVEFYEHTHYALFPDIFAMLVIVSSMAFVKHTYTKAHAHVFKHLTNHRARKAQHRAARHALRAEA